MKSLRHPLILAAAALAGTLAIASADPVVFNVNMSVQTALGNFNAGNGDTVRLLGLNGDWSTGVAMVPSVADTNIWTVTNDLAAGSWPNYKFVIAPAAGSWIWESPASFGGGNRYFQVPAGGTNLPVVYFSDVTNLPAYTVQITFQLDMEFAIQQGLFNMGSDYVDAFGSWNNWAATGVLLTHVPGTSNYVGTLTTTALTTNTVVSYKYTIDVGLIWENNGVCPGGAQNHQFTLSTSTNLPLDYFNNYQNLGPVQISGAPGQTVVFWASGTNVNNRIRLQKATNLLSGWSDVPNTQGVNSVTNDFGPGPVFFRLTGP